MDKPTQKEEPIHDVKPKPKKPTTYSDAYYDVPDERPDNYTADYFPPY